MSLKFSSTTPLAGCLLFLLGLSFFSCVNSPSPSAEKPISVEDQTAIVEACNSLANAWLAGNKEAVLSHYTFDAVLIPHHGDEQIEGKDNIERYWFNPMFAPPKVNRMDNHVIEVVGSGDWAFARGRGMLDYVFQNVPYSNTGNFFHVFRRTPDGWKIFRHVWTDPVPQQLPIQ